jgi:predicted transcriptional regulator
VTEKEYGRNSIAGVIKSYFNDSYLSAVSSFVKEEKISVEELKELIKQIEQND